MKIEEESSRKARKTQQKKQKVNGKPSAKKKEYIQEKQEETSKGKLEGEAGRKERICWPNAISSEWKKLDEDAAIILKGINASY